MKTIACYPVHYGKDYLAHSVRSVCASDAISEVHIFYSPMPSFGYQTPGVVCPDSEYDLRQEAHKYATKPIHWHYVTGVSNEGTHRNAFFNVSRDRGADLCLSVDADEIWDPEGLTATLGAVWKENSASRWLANFANFWQSWNWQVLDHFKPIRIVDMRHTPGPGVHFSRPDGYLTEEMQPQPVFHFGYAQREALMRYKWTCHGHQAELRTGWMDKFIQWTPESTDLHPCVNNLWDRAYPTEQKIMDKVNELLHDHPYKGLDIIR